MHFYRAQPAHATLAVSHCIFAARCDGWKCQAAWRRSAWGRGWAEPWPSGGGRQAAASRAKAALAPQASLLDMELGRGPRGRGMSFCLLWWGRSQSVPTTGRSEAHLENHRNRSKAALLSHTPPTAPILCVCPALWAHSSPYKHLNHQQQGTVLVIFSSASEVKHVSIAFTFQRSQ